MIKNYSHALWILYNYHILRVGEWPEPINEELGLKRIKRAVPHAYFENPILLSSEIVNRIKRCGQDSYIVEERFGLNGGISTAKSVPEIAQMRNMSNHKINKIISKVINYCVAEDMKGLSYDEWKRIRKP